MLLRSFRSDTVLISCLLPALLTVACGKNDDAPPVAAAAVTLPAEVAAGQSADVSYRFSVAGNAPPFAEDYVVFVHAFNEFGARIWTSDHEPPTPTRQWKAGSIVEYSRPMQVPSTVRGPVTLELGLYSPRTQERLPLTGDSNGSRAYRVGSLTVGTRTGGSSSVFAEGFYPVEAPEDAQGVEWHWSQNSGTIWLPNPKQDTEFVIDLDQPVTALAEPQHVEVRAGSKTLGAFTLNGGRRETHRIPVSAADAGTAAMMRLTVTVDRTFVPAKLTQGGSADTRELGVRVFNAYVEPAVR